MFDYYNKSNCYFLRAPLFSNHSNSYIEFNNIDETKLLKSLSEMWANPIFREAVYVSSEELYNAVCKILCDNRYTYKKLSSIWISVAKYWNRMCFRSTPFGLFAGVQAYPKKDSTQTRDNCKRVEVDYAWLVGVIKRLESEFFDCLHFSFNDFVCLKEDCFFLPYSNDSETECVYITISKSLQIIYDKFKRSRFSLLDVYNTLPVEEHLSIKGQLIDLNKHDVIISNLRPPIPANDYLLYLLSEIPQEYTDSIIIQRIKEIHFLMKNYERQPLGSGEGILDNLYGKMQELQLSDKYIAVDLVLPNEFEDMNFNQEIDGLNDFVNGIFEILYNYFDYSILKEYKKLFYKKYGDYREVPIKEMLDEYIGIGIPTCYRDSPKYDPNNKDHLPDVDPAFKKAFLEELIVTCKRKKTINIENLLSRARAIKVLNNLLPEGMDVIISLENKRMVCNPNIGVVGIARTIGRFTFDESIASIFNTLCGHETNNLATSTDFCDVFYIPRKARMGNIAYNCPISKNSLTGYTNSYSSQSRVLFEDILVGIKDGHFYFRNRKNGKIIKFRIKNMLSYFSDPAPVRFIKELSLDGVVHCDYSLLSWLDDYEYVPEISFMNIIIRPESWCIDISNVAKEQIDLKKQISSFIKEYNLPGTIKLKSGDNFLRLNLIHESSIMIMTNELKKSGKITIFRDYSEKTAGKPKEIIQSFFLCNEAPRKKFHGKEMTYIEHKACAMTPGDEWVSVTLRGCNDKSFVPIMLPELISKIETKNKIEQFFFVRYKDPFRELRIRFKVNSPFNCINTIASELKHYKDKCLISEFDFVTYDREVERYGGDEKSICTAESVFSADSELALRVLRDIKDEDLIIYLIVSNIALMRGLGITYYEQLNLLEKLIGNKFNQKEYLLIKNKMSTLIISSFEDEYGDAIANRLKRRQIECEKYSKIIREKDYSVKETIAQSLLHMSFNRIIGMDHEKEKKILSFTRRLLFEIVSKEGVFPGYFKELIWDK